jgi:hypothetical protein
MKSGGFVLCLLAIVLIGDSESWGKNAKYDPEDAIRPIRALLAMSDAKPSPTCEQGKIIEGKPGPPQLGDLIAILLAYHDAGINAVRGSCERKGDARCSVMFTHKDNSRAEEQHAIFRFNIVNGQAQPHSLECELSP